MLRKCESANSTITPRFEESNSCHSSTATHCRFSKKFSFRFLSEKQMQTFWSYHQNFRHVFGLFCFSDAEMSPFSHANCPIQSNFIYSRLHGFRNVFRNERSGVTKAVVIWTSLDLSLIFLDD